MLKRLLIAVFVLGLILTLNGTAISDVQKGELNPVIKINPNAPMYNERLDGRPEQPAFKKPESALQEIPPGQTIPSPPQTYFYEIQDYTAGTANYGWKIPDAYGDNLSNMRFTAEDGYDCNLKVAYYLMYGGAYLSGAQGITGDPDFKAYLWDDNGYGFPGNKLDSVIIPWATVQAEWLAQGDLFYLTADFSAGNWVFSDGETHFFGWTTVQNSSDDALSVVSDAANGPYAGEERSSEYVTGLWGTMLNDWGLDVSLHIYSERLRSEMPTSDCYVQSYWQNVAYIWMSPHPAYGITDYTQRFSVHAAETLMSVDVAIHQRVPPNDIYFGNDTVFVGVRQDASGLPGALVAQDTILPGTYSAYPAWTTADFSSFNLVFYDDFYISFNSSGVAGVDYETCKSDDGNYGLGRSFCYYGGDWYTVGDLFGIDVNFMFDAYMCRTYTECAWDWCYVDYVWFWKLPDRYGDVAQAQKFSAAGYQECRVQDVCWYLYNSGSPNAYTYQSKVSVYTDAGGLPGSEMSSILIGPGTSYPYVMFPSPMCVDFEPAGVYVSGDYWVTIESFGTDSSDGIRTLSDEGGGTCMDAWAEAWYDGPNIVWSLMCNDWGGITCDWAVLVDVFTCCAKYAGRGCGVKAGDDWATYQHDYARTGASLTSLGDAWCDLTLDWTYTDPGGTTNGVYDTGPIIAFGRIVCSFYNKYMVFGLDGTIKYTLSGGPLGDGFRCQPTVDVVGTDTLLFVSGGSYQEFAAYHFNTGVLKWQTGPLGQQVRYGRSTILDMGGGIKGIFWPTDNGRVYGANASNGAWLWPFPYYVNLNAPVYVSNATDGEQLFFCTAPTAVNGDIYAYDAATGVQNWFFSNILLNPQGLMGDDLWPFALLEVFNSGISYDAVLDAIYANSGQVGVSLGTQYPTDGILYSVNATTGIMNWATLANRGLYQTPIVDTINVYMPNLSTWVGPVGGPAGGYLFAADKITGAIVNTYNAPAGGQTGYRRYRVDALLTCEPDDSDYPEDLLFAFNEDGWFSCVQSTSFNEIYRRRMDHLNSATNSDRGMAGAIATDSFGVVHLVYTTFWGDLFDMVKKDDRPRFEIQTYNPILPVEFGSNPHLIATIPGVFTNTGCANLNFENVQVDENTFNQHIPFFATQAPGESEFMDRAAKIADKLQREAFLSKYLRTSDEDVDNILSVSEMSQGKETMNRAAAAFPSFLNSVIHPAPPDFIIPGETTGIELDIIQPAIQRGPQIFYMLMDTDDPDFFLNDTVRGVEICVTLVGGCLVDTTTLLFGENQDNEQLVANTGRLGTGDWGDGPAGYNGFLIDADGASYFQGAYVYGVSQYRIATNTQAWAGGGEAESFISLQGDPNWCDDNCKPDLNVGVPLGKWSLTGTGYETIIGDMVCKSFLDSCQDFSLGGGPAYWDWEEWGAPFDNALTMGLYVNGRVVGAYKLSPSNDPIPDLANVTLEILEFTERNGAAVDNWYFGEIYDCDNGGDSVGIDRSISTAWTYNRPAKDQAWGQIKIPFGCAYEPILNTWGTYGASGTPGHGFWGWGVFWDQCYTFMSSGTGAFADGNMTSGDQEALVTFATKDFAAVTPHDTMSIGIAHFALHEMTDASSSAEIAPLAILVNKWAGFGRGDVNNDGSINIADIVHLAGTVNGGPGAIPFEHLSDVNADGNIDIADFDYLFNWYFFCGPCPLGDWIF